MADSKRSQATIVQERALLVSVILPDTEFDRYDPLGEIRSLAKTAGAIVVDEMIANRQNVQPGMYVGKGKGEEIAARVVQNDIDVVIFDNDLAPGQIRELEKVIGRKVLDRSEVILDIFAAHARTAEAMLQVELAQLEYTYPRLRHMWSHLERTAGGAATSSGAAVGGTATGIGTRGPGEKQIEIDRRLVQKRVTELKSRIVAIDKRKERAVESRLGNFKVCLVGYTNAGKSSLMNLFTGAGVLVANKLFATLDTRTRQWNLGAGTRALLSDTVGFISHLPHHLVASFRATLEEAIGADLLLHVADGSHPRVQVQIDAVNAVLKELELDAKPQMLLLNKSDLIVDPATRTLLTRKHPNAVFLSAATGENAGTVVQAVLNKIRGPEVSVVITADVANGKLMQYLDRFAVIADREYTDNRVKLTATLGEKQLDAVKALGAEVEAPE
jgi:GTP-binding protein HflX